MASVQFNLLPDVKLEYIKTQRTKNLITTIALIASGASIVIFLLVLAGVDGVQKRQLSDANSGITTASNQLEGISDLSQILTVQNQLRTLVTLHQQKPLTSRIFGYLSQITPSNAYIGSLVLDSRTNNLTIEGTADSQTTVNTFIDTLKFTTYQIGPQDSQHQAFSSVVENSFSINGSTVNYGLTVTYDPLLFSNDIADVPTLSVPKLTTTRSVLEDPTATLFNGQTGPSTSTNSTKSGSQ